MADLKEMELDLVSDCDFIRALKDGVGVRILKANLLDSTLVHRGNITIEQTNKVLKMGTYYHSESIIPGESIYGILLVLNAADIQCQIDITLEGRIFFRLSHGWDIDNPVWSTQWSSIM